MPFYKINTVLSYKKGSTTKNIFRSLKNMMMNLTMKLYILMQMLYQAPSLPGNQASFFEVCTIFIEIS